MCGISALVDSCGDTSSLDATSALLAPGLERRGPDVSQTHRPHPWAALLASVLHLRGDRPCVQPLVLGRDALCWNGQSFADDAMSGQATLRVPHGSSDTRAVLAALAASTGDSDDEAAVAAAVLACMAKVHGPWAFVYWHAATHTLWWGRDPLGRRSLLFAGGASLSALCGEKEDSKSGLLEQATFAVASVAPRQGVTFGDGRQWTTWEEVPTAGLFAVRLPSLATPSTAAPSLLLRHYPWPSRRRAFRALQSWQSVQPTVASTAEDADHIAAQSRGAQQGDAEAVLLKSLAASVAERIVSIPPPPRTQTTTPTLAPPARVALLFSGGLDSVVLAALTHRALADQGAPEEPIDLLNVCFDAPRHCSPDRLAAAAAVQELRALHPRRPWRLLAIDVEPARMRDPETRARLLGLLVPACTEMDLNIGAALHFAATGEGRLVTSDAELQSLASAARLADAEARRRHVREAKASTARAETRARQRAVGKESGVAGKGRRGATDCPGVGCKFVSHRRCVHGLCKRCCSKHRRALLLLGASDGGGEVDKAVRCPVHDKAKRRKEKGAAEAKSEPASKAAEAEVRGAVAGSADAASTSMPSVPDSACSSCSSTRRWRSAARVLLLGTGADELMGGYGRHRTAFARGGYEQLRTELLADVRRLWIRNHGRDDRCIGDTGREARYPFLAASVVDTLGSLPLRCVADLSLPRGVGDKMILRGVARLLGLKHPANLAKRAIQFGTRVARWSKRENKKEGKQKKKKKLTGDTVLLPPPPVPTTKKS